MSTKRPSDRDTSGKPAVSRVPVTPPANLRWSGPGSPPANRLELGPRPGSGWAGVEAEALV